MSKKVTVVLRASKGPSKRHYANLTYEVTAESIRDAVGEAAARAIQEGYLGRFEILRVQMGPFTWLDLGHIQEALNGNGPHAGAW